MVVDEEAEEVRSAVDWAEVRAMHADGIKKREIRQTAGDQPQHGRQAGRGNGAAEVLESGGRLDA